MITIDRLRYFVEVATLEHAAQAAKNMFVSPSVISSAINILEEELGCPLFDKENNRLRLNPNGQILLEQAKKIISNVESLPSKINKTNLELQGHFKIGASPFLMREFMVNKYLEIQKNNPKITADFISYDTGLAVSNVLSGAIDFALVFRSIQHQDLEEYILYNGQFQIAVRKDHPIFETKKKDRVNTLNTLPAITFRTSVGPNFCETHPAFKRHGITPKHKYFYDNNDISLKLLCNTDGWALLPDLLIKKFSKKIAVLPIASTWDAPMIISLIKNKNRTSLPIFNILKNELKFDQ